MRQKIRKGKLEACKLVWKKRITAEKGISDKCAERIVQECIKLIDRMLYGNVVIAFYKQDGTFCLERGTLVGLSLIHILLKHRSATRPHNCEHNEMSIFLSSY